ncbi:MAG: prepilin-type N-terminal cleavage/methylation domain-containing protein [candidate division WOR-3 bacterium]
MRFIKGYTLIEAIIVITLIAIIAFGFGSFIVTAMQNWILVSSRDSLVNNARHAMNRLTAELRRIRKPQNILTYTTSEVEFIDIDANTINFKQSGVNLLRNTDVLVTNLATPEGLRFTYLDATGEVTNVKQNIRSIRVWVYLISKDQFTTLESSARIRNL